METVIYAADVRGLDESRSLCRGRSNRPGSAFAASLLCYALREQGIAERLPEFGADEYGKPCFPALPGVYFSLSHTRGMVLAAVSEAPIGVDVEAEREAPPLLLKTMDEQERRDFEFLDLWVLRESFCKLNGHGDLRTIRFRRKGNKITPPDPNVTSQLYKTLHPHHTAASARTRLPEEIRVVRGAALVGE